MESTSETTRAAKSPIAFPPESAQEIQNQENSGIYEIQALAKSAKKRQSRRLSSQMDAQESLLASAAALDSIALPDPTKSTEIRVPSVALSTSAEAATSSTFDAVVSTNPYSADPDSATPDLKGSSKTWLFVGVGVVACAAAAFFMITNGDEAKTASKPAAKVAAAVVTAPVVDELPEPVAKPLPAEVVEEALVPAVVEELTVLDDRVEEAQATKEVPKKTELKVAALEKKSAKADRRAKKQNESKPTRVALEAKAEAKAKAKADKSAKAKAKEKPKKLSKGASIDDVLSSVTGGVDTPIVTKVETVKKPSKKRLERSDVAKAMKRISGAAKGCYSVEEFSGMVTVKYSVGPSGAITKAAATGKHKSSKTGKCVTKAVKKAKFPPFDGATMSFSFPFLLAP